MGRAAPQKLAVVTGASTGIGYELAIQCAKHGYDLLVVADEPQIQEAADTFRKQGVKVDALELNLASTEGCEKLIEALGERPVDALLANAGRGLGRAFLDQYWEDIRAVIDTNVTGTVYLIHKIARRMRNRNEGKILITGSIAGFMPGTYQAVYNATKAFLDSFSFALRAELKDTGVTVTCLMPGATETDFFERADMMDTKVGTQEKDDPADVAKTVFEEMVNGEGYVFKCWQNKLQSAIAGITPAGMLAERHRRMAAPGTAKT